MLRSPGTDVARETKRGTASMKSAACLPERRLLFLLGIASLLVMAAQAHAAQKKTAPFAGYSKYVRYHVHYDVNADGSHVETRDLALKVLAPQGVAEVNREYVTYSDRLEKAKIVSAYTLKKDGRRVNVPPSNFQEEINKGRGKASPMFSDLRTITVAFPEVGVGDTVVFEYKVTQTKPTMPGNFSFIQTFSKFYDYDDAQVSMSAPASLKMQVEARGVKGGEIAAKNGRRNWLWTFRNQRIATPEPAAVSALDYGPLIVASTFNDYSAVAAGYDARARAKAKPNGEIRKLADTLTRNAHTPREQAAALYYWVARNISFAGNCVGVGSVVPHDAALVLKNRMGDCKDHSTLLQAMLASKGIASTSVLIHSGNAFTLPEVPTLDVFNHVITYIPSLRMYADSTSRFTPFGFLPIGDADKPVIFTSDYNGIQHTPPTNWKDNGTVTDTGLTINPDGSATGETRSTSRGIFAGSARAAMTYLPPNLDQELVRRALAKNGYTGSGTLRKDDPSKPADVYHLTLQYKISDAMNLPGPAAFLVREPIGGSTAASLVSDANDPKRTVNFSCTGLYEKEHYTIHLPNNVKVLAIPHDVHLKGYRATYSATYRQSGNTVTVMREFDDMTPGNVCTPHDSAELKPFALRALKDLRTQILYR